MPWMAIKFVTAAQIISRLFPGDFRFIVDFEISILSDLNVLGLIYAFTFLEMTYLAVSIKFKWELDICRYINTINR